MGPAHIGPFRLLGRLGFGGMSEVFKAEYCGDEMWGGLPVSSLVALKRMLPSASEDAACRDAFARECRRAPSMSHLRLPKTYGVFEHHRSHELPPESHLVLECLEGSELSVLYAKGPSIEPQPWWVLAAIGLQVSEVLAYLTDFMDPDADEPGLIHGDLSPKNLHVTSQGCVKLLDFGMAMPMGRTTSMQIGGHGYMSPEYVRGEALDFRSDIFSLGIVLYELGAGQRLFKAPSPAETIDLLLNKPIPTMVECRPDMPASLAMTIDRCLSRQRQERPLSPDGLREVFSSCLMEADQGDSEHMLARWCREALEGGNSQPVSTPPRAKSSVGNAHASTDANFAAEQATLAPAERTSSLSPKGQDEISVSTFPVWWVWGVAVMALVFMLATTSWYIGHMLD